MRVRWIRVDPMPSAARSWDTLVPLPGFLALASLNVGARSVPVIASVVLHASIAVGLVATSAGHSQAGTTTPIAAASVDVDLLEPVTPAPPPVERAAKDVPLATHTHAYAVDPSHDARPHDPSLKHDAHHDDDHDRDQAAAPAPAAPAAALTSDSVGTLPRFDLSAGSAAPMGARVASNATGTGAGTGTATAPTASASDEVVHSAASVQVAARPLHAVNPAYPVHARADEVEGDVEVEIVVERDGRVIDARVTRRAGHGFDEAALAAIRGYRFSPAQREGRSVRVRMPWSVQFRLR